MEEFICAFTSSYNYIHNTKYIKFTQLCIYLHIHCITQPRKIVHVAIPFNLLGQRVQQHIT